MSSATTEPVPQGTATTPLPRARERRILALLTLASFVLALNANVMGPLFPFIDGELGLTESQKGYLLAAANFASALAALLLGPLVDRLGRRPPLLVGLVAFAVLSLAHLVATSYTTLLVLRGATGFALGIAFTSASAAVADLVPGFRLGKAMGIFSSGLFLAAAFGLPGAVMLAMAGWWRAIFVVQAAVAAIACLGPWMLPPGLGRGSQRVSPAIVLRQRGVFAALVAIMVSVGAFMVSIQLSGDWLDRAEILRKEDHGPFWMGLGLCSAVGSIFVTPLADRIGKHSFALLSAAVLFALLVLLSGARSFHHVSAVAIPLAIAGGARTGAAQALIAELVPQHMRGTLMGLRSASITAGAGLCSLAGGWVVEAYGYPTFLRLAGGMMVVSYVLVRFFVPKDS